MSGSLEAAGTPSRDAQDRLFRNDLESAVDLAFTDVTGASGLDTSGLASRRYGMGVATGDIDNDGDVDLYVTNFGDTNFGGNQLFRNEGDGTFADITQEAGVADSSWSVSAAFFDSNGDGWLDLYVGNYVDYTLAGDKPCYRADSARDYCSPASYRPVPDRLFQNRGDGTFEDVSERSGIRSALGAALGATVADYDGDGQLDLYVANDGMANHLWLRDGDGVFRNAALLAGTALNFDGLPEAGMGVATGDFDSDGDEDVVVAHLAGETHTLYANDGRGFFVDVTTASGLAAASLPFTSFGTGWLDYDNDGDLDLLTVSGAVTQIPALARSGDPYPLHQVDQLFENAGATFREVPVAGSPLAISAVSRGAAFGDVDNDGDVDVLISDNNGPVRLLLNESPPGRWLGLRLLTTTGRDALGAVARVRLADGRTLLRRCRTDGSYASARDPRVVFGLGDAEVDGVEVRWVGGRTETFEVEVDRYTIVVEGTGR